MQSALVMLGVATGVSTLLATLLSLPFTPARLWSWRLRKHMETVNAIDPERQPNQYEVVMRHADALASKLAAAQHIPTDWGRFRGTMVAVGYPVGVVSSAILMLQRGYRPWDGMTPVDGFTFVVS